MSNHPTHSGLSNWIALRRYTPARIAIGRVGCGLPLSAHLEFQAAHAKARDAVHAKLDVETIVRALAVFNSPVCTVSSAAPTREVFLRQPNLGRVLSSESKAKLSEPMISPDIVIVIADGLSSIAVEHNARSVLTILWPQIQKLGYQLGPLVVATQARVALADQIGELLQARLSIIMIGERPGLSAADSLGLYLTYEPRVGRTDSERNCISNIRNGGMTAEHAAAQALDLIRSMFSHGASGVRLGISRIRKRDLDPDQT
jgi:ethanolamine ammonia-lyase small subunit